MKAARAATGSGVSLMRPCSDGESIVAGQIALQRIPSLTKSAATHLVRPMTAALEAPYAKRLTTPISELAIDDMLMMLPPPASIIPGRNASHTRKTPRLLTANVLSHSSNGVVNAVP